MATIDSDQGDHVQGLTAPPRYRVSVQEVLEVDCLAGTTVLAGARGLGRIITRLNVMEVPDVIDWVKPHELLVTSGYPLISSDHDPDAQAQTLLALIRALDERETAALGIKVSRYLGEVPDAVLRLADELDFPILGLPEEIAFDDLLQQVHDRLYEVHANVLERIDALHAALARLVLEGGDLEHIADEVARVLKVGILLTTTDGRSLAEALTPQMRDALEVAELFSPEGRFRVERIGTGPLAVGPGQIRLQAIVAGPSDLARLVCFDPGRQISSADMYALDRAATVAALLMTRQKAVSAVESKYRGDFLRDVFSGRAGDAEYVREHAAGLGWDMRLPAVVVLSELEAPAPSDEPVPGGISRDWQGRFFSAWRQVVLSHDRSVPTADFSAEVVTLLPVPAGFDGAPDEARAALRATVARLVAQVAGDRGGGRRPFAVGVSRTVESLDQLPAAYAQARRAADVGRRVNGSGSTTHFDDLGIHRLIGLVPDQGELMTFARDVLGELADDTVEARELRTTLQVLLDTNLNVAEASRLQFFHYNTMRYRIGKLERILGPFTSDPNLRLNIAVALQVKAVPR